MTFYNQLKWEGLQKWTIKGITLDKCLFICVYFKGHPKYDSVLKEGKKLREKTWLYSEAGTGINQKNTVIHYGISRFGLSDEIKHSVPATEIVMAHDY